MTGVKVDKFKLVKNKNSSKTDVISVGEMKRYHKDITISDRYQAMVQNDSSLANSFSTGKISDRERHYNKFRFRMKLI